MAAKAMYQDALPFFPQFPPKLQTINFPLANTTASDSTKAEANAILLDFLSKIEAFLKLKASPVNYTALWDQMKPDPALPPLSVLLNRTYPTLISKEQTKNVRDPFFADYAAMNDGRLPFVDPVPKVCELMSCNVSYLESYITHIRAVLIVIPNTCRHGGPSVTPFPLLSSTSPLPTKLYFKISGKPMSFLQVTTIQPIALRVSSYTLLV